MTTNTKHAGIMTTQTQTEHIKNAAAVALGRLNKGRTKQLSPELRERKRGYAARARAALAAKREAAKGVQS